MTFQWRQTKNTLCDKMCRKYDAEGHTCEPDVQLAFAGFDVLAAKAVHLSKGLDATCFVQGLILHNPLLYIAI